MEVILSSLMTMCVLSESPFNLVLSSLAYWVLGKLSWECANWIWGQSIGKNKWFKRALKYNRILANFGKQANCPANEISSRCLQGFKALHKIKCLKWQNAHSSEKYHVVPTKAPLFWFAVQFQILPHSLLLLISPMPLSMSPRSHSPLLLPFTLFE